MIPGTDFYQGPLYNPIKDPTLKPSSARGCFSKFSQILETTHQENKLHTQWYEETSVT